MITDTVSSFPEIYSSTYSKDRRRNRGRKKAERDFDLSVRFDCRPISNYFHPDEAKKNFFQKETHRRQYNIVVHVDVFLDHLYPHNQHIQIFHSNAHLNPSKDIFSGKLLIIIVEILSFHLAEIFYCQ